MTKFLFLFSYFFATCSLLALPHSHNNMPVVFRSDVKSVTLYNPDLFMAPPVIRLNSDDRLCLNFDIIGDTHQYLRARLLHCNADWSASRLLESEYTDGFNESEISDFAYSSNTYVHYVNYNLEIPSPGLTPLAPGNYLLQVFPEENHEDVLLQTRFAVSDNSVSINVAATSRTDFGFNDSFQQLSLQIGLPPIQNLYPYQDVIVTIEQNNRPETLRTLTHPSRVENSTLFFEHSPLLIFPASNEFRRFETVRADYPGMNVDSVFFGGTNWHAYLVKDIPRTNSPYTYDKTQHGRFKIDSYNASDPNLGADYITVHFSLDAPYQPELSIFVDGDFTSHTFTEANKMNYDHTLGRYAVQIPLKQGSYNYQYVAASKSQLDSDSPLTPEENLKAPDQPDGFFAPSPSPIEGDHYETSNEYLIKVFLNQPGSRATRLVGATLLIFP